ncbi:MAG: ABC transporter ATP-binding protein [Chthoniobacteraceae bacterium]|jgi:ABC-2 type transport system ATP-binding protein
MDAVDPSLAIRDLVKSYGTTRAVDSVSLEVGAGEILGLLGPNGAGKTTVVECALGLRTADSGSIRIAGHDAREQPTEVKRRVGAVLQSTALQDVITPREALELFGAFYPKAIAAADLLDRFSLAEKADARFETLSGGQRQRLALALAFVNDPALLFLDEPTSGLDPQARRQLHEVIRQFRAEGRAVLLTTHYIEEAHALCDRIAILHRGRIVATGTPDELIARSGAGARIIVRAAQAPDTAALGRLPGISGVTETEGAVTLQTKASGAAVIELVNYLARTGNELLDLQVRKPSLEDIFIELTGDSGAGL